MLGYIWSLMILISVICSAVTGRVDILSDSVLSGAGEAVKVVITTLGAMAFWSGLMRLAEDSGLVDVIAKFLSPVLDFLFPDYYGNNKVINPICMNIVANLMGLGNAATPFGLQAMKEMQKVNINKAEASDGMVMLLVINTACLQLVPTFLAVMRKNYGSQNPFEILPCLWITSFTALIIGVAAVKFWYTKKKDSSRLYTKCLSTGK